MKVTAEKRRDLWLLAAVPVLLLLCLCVRPVRNAWLDLTFYWTQHTETELLVKAYAEERGISIGEYPRSLIELLERNPETKDFVLSYPFREETAPEPLSTQESGIPLLLQWDTRWGYTRYGGDFLAVTGCGPACLAMAGYSLTGDKTMTPDAVARFAEQNGYYARGYGSSWTLISQGAGKLGLTATELPLVKKKITDALEAGCPVILAMGPGDFTATGHYILLTGMEDGLFRVNDPNSLEKSQRLWSYETLESQIRNIWAIGLP